MGLGGGPVWTQQVIVGWTFDVHHVVSGGFCDGKCLLVLAGCDVVVRLASFLGSRQTNGHGRDVNRGLAG